jgi:hypothetical protein
MLLVTLLIGSIALTAIAFSLKKAALAFMAAILWIVFAVDAYSISATPTTGVWDMYFALVWLGVAGILLCVLEPAIMRQKKEDAKEDVFVDDIDKYQEELNSYARQTRLPRLRRK